MEINNASVFVLPVLGKHYTFYGNLLEQCYLCNQQGLENCICFVFKSKINDELDMSMKELTGFKQFETKDGKYIYIYNIPEEYINDISLFKNGKYSQMSEIYKQKVLKCNISASIKDVTSIKLYKILYKHPSLRKYWEEIVGQPLPEGSEVWSVPDMEREVFQF